MKCFSLNQKTNYDSAHLCMSCLLILTLLSFLFTFAKLNHERFQPMDRVTLNVSNPQFFLDKDEDGVNMLSDMAKQLATGLQETGQTGEVIFSQVPSFARPEERDKWCAERYGSDDIVVVNVMGTPSYSGFRMALYKDKDVVSQNVIYYGNWELWLTDEIFRVFGNSKMFAGKTFIDVGANVGWFTLVALSKGITVLAFEPDQKNRRLIEYSVCLNEGFEKNLTLYSLGLAEQNQTCYILSAKDNEGDGNTVCNKVQQDALYSHSILFFFRNMAQFTTLDNLLASNQDIASRSFSVMKLDTEGHEVNILSKKGSSNFFANRETRPAVLFVELFKCFNGKCEEDRSLVELMIDRGYTIWRSIDGFWEEKRAGWKNMSTSFDELMALGPVPNAIFVDRSRINSDFKNRP